MYFEEFQLGDRFTVPPVTIDREEMMAFARRYDNIPLHTDEDYARTTRFGGLIAPGVMTFMSVWARYLEHDLCGRELIAGKSTKIEWLKPVYAEDVLSADGEVTALTRRNGRNGTVELSFLIRNQRGEPVMTNVTEAVVKCRPAEAEQGGREWN